MVHWALFMVTFSSGVQCLYTHTHIYLVLIAFIIENSSFNNYFLKILSSDSSRRTASADIKTGIESNIIMYNCNRKKTVENKSQKILTPDVIRLWLYKSPDALVR